MKRISSSIIIILIICFGYIVLNNYSDKELNQPDVYTASNVILISGVTQNKEGESLITQIKILDDKGQLLSRHQTNLDGAFELSLPKGSYVIEFSKGYEYQTIAIKVNVTDDLPIKLGSIILEKEFDWSIRGYYGGDFHQHSIYSDGKQKVADIFLSNLATGMSFGMLSDHNSTDGLGEWMLTTSYKLGHNQLFVPIGGVEVTTSKGHFQAIDTQQIYDVAQLDNVEQLQALFENMKLSSALIQINHPMRRDKLGYNHWDLVDCFNAMEIWNGHALPPMDNIYDVLDQFAYNAMSKRKWFELLNSGKRIVATSGSDNHDITSQSLVEIQSENQIFNDWYSQGLYTGNPATYVKVNELTRENILNALEKGASFLTNGPLLDVSINGKSFGDTIPFNEIAKININAVSNKGNLKSINIIADGNIIKTINVGPNNVTESIELNVSSYDYLVFEVITNSYGYAISNAIYIN